MDFTASESTLRAAENAFAPVAGRHKRDVDFSGANAFIVEGGASDYTVALPENAHKTEEKAAEELVRFFGLATGVTLPVVRQRELSAGKRYIALGKTLAAAALGAEALSQPLGACGLRLLTQSGNIYAFGHTEKGTLYAVYELLAVLLNFEVFSAFSLRLDRGVSQLALPRLDVTEIPDFQYRSPSHAYTKYNEELVNRFRLTEIDDLIFGEGGLYHNTFNYLPLKDYAADHPKWYSDIEDPLEKQLCYTAHGDENERRLLEQEAAKKLIEYIKKNPDARYIAFTHQDNFNWCECEACKSAKEKDNGANSGTLVRFLNRVRSAIQEWLDGEGKAYDINQKLVFFAYHGTNKPPVGYDEKTDAFSYIDEHTKLRGVVPFFAETNGDYTCPLTDGAVNAPIAHNLRGWRFLCDEVLFWTYCTNFSYYLTPYNSFGGTQKTYQFAAAQGAGLIFDEGQIDASVPTSWEELKGYLYYKLTWNVNADAQRLTEDYFGASFLAAAPAMKRIFDDYIALSNDQIASGYSGSRSIFIDPLKKEWWPKERLEGWLRLVDEAKAALQPIKQSDPEGYKNAMRNVTLESVAPLYLYTTLYAGETEQEKSASGRLKTALKHAIQSVGIDKLAERKPIDVLFE